LVNKIVITYKDSISLSASNQECLIEELCLTCGSLVVVL